MTLAVVLALVPGILLDNWLGSSPIFTLAGIVLGLGAAFFTVWDVARRAMRR
jgi:F0F1-type ATP synthase assembly protein I